MSDPLPARTSVAVIGAGPAGSAAAITLAQQGMDVVLLERGSPGKDKPCGDALMPTAVTLLEELGLPSHFYRQHVHHTFRMIDLFDEHQRVWQIDIGTQPGWIVPRARLDQALRDQAESLCRLAYQCRVKDLQPADNGWNLTIRTPQGQEHILADGVILATGATNSLGRRFGVDGQPIPGASISVYAPMKEIEAPLFQFVLEGLPGYGWVFPLGEDMVNIGVCAVGQAASHLRALTEDYLKRWNVQSSAEFRGGAGPLWSGRGSVYTHPHGLISCGDAAGLVDPITGEGVGPALASGQQAARQIAAFLKTRDLATLNAYNSWISDYFGQMYRPTTVRRAWSRLCQIPLHT